MRPRISFGMWWDSEAGREGAGIAINTISSSTSQVALSFEPSLSPSLAVALFTQSAALLSTPAQAFAPSISSSICANALSRTFMPEVSDTRYGSCTSYAAFAWTTRSSSAPRTHLARALFRACANFCEQTARTNRRTGDWREKTQRFVQPGWSTNVELTPEGPEDLNHTLREGPMHASTVSRPWFDNLKTNSADSTD